MSGRYSQKFKEKLEDPETIEESLQMEKEMCKVLREELDISYKR
jgi:hypothetical protein